jgi:hypothetical protein
VCSGGKNAKMKIGPGARPVAARSARAIGWWIAQNIATL